MQNEKFAIIILLINVYKINVELMIVFKKKRKRNFDQIKTVLEMKCD